MRGRIKYLIIILCCFICTMTFTKVMAATATYKWVMIGMADEDGADRQGNWLYGDKINQSLNKMDLPGVTSYRLINASANSGLEYLKNSSLFAVHTHGSRNSVKFTADNGSVTYLKTNNMKDLAQDALSAEKLVIYGTCSAGIGGINDSGNIVNVTFSKGAQHVIGFQDLTYVYQTNDFLEEFLVDLGEYNETIEEAYNNALYFTKYFNDGDAGGIDDVLIRGDVKVSLAK